MTAGSVPTLTLVVVVYRMSAQAMRTLQSLLPPYQVGVSGTDYEVLVVENESDDMLDAATVTRMGVRYLARHEAGHSPVAACNEGLRQAAGSHMALMIDGARMVTPGLVRTVLDALSCRERPVVAVPGYHLGATLQRTTAETGYDSAAEGRLLDSIAWPHDGYRLFDISVLSGSCANGYLVPIAESNCLALPQEMWRELGYLDERFQSLGGGFVNLDTYRRACQLPGAGLLLLPGEGTFHQFHGGATTGQEGIDRDALLAAITQEYQDLRGVPFAPPKTAPILFGSVSAPAARYLQYSAQRYREVISTA